MSNNSLTFVDSVICFKEQIDKEETSKRLWKGRYGNSGQGWRPVEPFEKDGASAREGSIEPPCAIFVPCRPPPDTLIVFPCIPRR